jgi:hypothetical protein
MALKTTAVARNWLSSDHVGTPKETNATTAHNKGKKNERVGWLVGWLVGELDNRWNSVVVSCGC